MRFFYLIIAVFGASSVQATLEYTLEHSSVCDPVAKKRTVKLGNKERSALHLTEGKLFKHWTGTRSFNCTFLVQGISKDELSVVVQNLNFRKDPVTEECIDYVQFYQENGKILKYCGELKVDNPIDLDVNNLLDNAILHFKEDILVNVFVSRIPLDPEVKLKFDIVFTSFKLCSENAADYAPCGDTKMCIWEGLFYDGNINCPYNGCYDEKLCFNPYPEHKKTKYQITSELNLLFILATTCVLMVVVVCAYFKCQAYFLDDGIPVELRCGTPTCATAPPLEDPKDAPPPYHSLFPDSDPEQGPEVTLLVQPPPNPDEQTARITGPSSAAFST
ncbi:Hypothetical predicted protein [Cloeon dipterum]|uniref:CUB domain-containing protein n=1 Tax=Cloeon dipterum TaxID=197152 RepID=A0A8S1CHR9_9INSE|nr:Hypothetical predicted protein [Cloeon dipterum]